MHFILDSIYPLVVLKCSTLLKKIIKLSEDTGRLSENKMDNGTVMSDDVMHMETMYKDDDIEKHDAEGHWDHE